LNEKDACLVASVIPFLQSTTARSDVEKLFTSEPENAQVKDILQNLMALVIKSAYSSSSLWLKYIFSAKDNLSQETEAVPTMENAFKR
jgi:hypothetical protein